MTENVNKIGTCRSLSWSEFVKIFIQISGLNTKATFSELNFLVFELTTRNTQQEIIIDNISCFYLHLYIKIYKKQFSGIMQHYVQLNIDSFYVLYLKIQMHSFIILIDEFFTFKFKGSLPPCYCYRTCEKSFTNSVKI